MIKVFAVANSTYFITENNVYAAGNNLLNQLGLGDNDNRSVPAEIKFLKNKKITNIIGGQDYTFAISENGEVYAFGKNDVGQLGLGNNTRQLNPVKNETLSNFTSKDIKTGSEHNLLVENGKLYAWGYNYFGQLGLDDDEDRYIPTEIKFFSNKNIKIKKVYAGHYHSFAITTDNKLYVWGSNYYGQLGLADYDNRYIPTELTFFRDSPIKDIGSKDFSSLILTEDGKLYSFGYNRNGQLGLAHFNKRSTPQRINVDNKLVDKIVSGRESTIAITEDGAIYGWGLNDFLDSEGFNDESIPFPIRLHLIEELNPVEIIKGDSSIFLKLQNEEIYVLGVNFEGELGLGHNFRVSTPTKLDLSFIQ